MALRQLTEHDRPLLRRATLANMNWNSSRFTFDDVDGMPEIAHYYTAFPAERDFGLVDDDSGTARAVAWLVFLPEDEPGYGFVDVNTPELSITTFEGFRGRGIGGELLAQLITLAEARGITSISLSVEDGNSARHLYERAGFNVVGRNGGSDTMLLKLG
jgi:ribosomal protein S18 acetylase RimI-like enzyme